MTTIIKLKRKSVSGNNPSPSDLEHGELAINYADGKLYYKNSSNAIAQFLDSGQIVSMIDSAYIDDRVNLNYLDSTEVHGMLDSVFGNIDQHIVPNGNELYDLGDSLNRFRDLYISGQSISFGGLVMSEHTGRVRFTNHTTGAEVKLAASNINQHLIDSVAILDIIDETFLDSQLQVLNYMDSGQINTRIDAFIDSAVFALIDSSFYLDSALMKQIPSVTGGVLTYDSATGLSLIHI